MVLQPQNNFQSAQTVGCWDIVSSCSALPPVAMHPLLPTTAKDEGWWLAVVGGSKRASGVGNRLRELTAVLKLQQPGEWSCLQCWNRSAMKAALSQSSAAMACLHFFLKNVQGNLIDWLAATLWQTKEVESTSVIRWGSGLQPIYQLWTYWILSLWSSSTLLSTAEMSSTESFQL